MIGDSVPGLLYVSMSSFLYLQTRGKSKVPGCQVYGGGPNILLE